MDTTINTIKENKEHSNLFAPDSMNLNEKLETCLNLSQVEKDDSCCKLCDCNGYIQGNPSTVCGVCGHDWNVHKC